MAVRGFQPLYTSRFSNVPLPPLPSKDSFARNGTSACKFFAPDRAGGGRDACCIDASVFHVFGWDRAFLKGC